MQLCRSPVTFHFPLSFKIKDLHESKDASKENQFAFNAQKCDYSSRLFVPVAESITLEFKRLTYEALTSAVSQGAGTKPRIARFVVQIPEETERTGSEVEERGGIRNAKDRSRRWRFPGLESQNPGAFSVILIRKYNDRRLAEDGGARGDKGGRANGEEGGSDGVACERRLPRICYGPIAIVSPYLRVPLRHCSPPPVWLAASSGRVAVYT